MTGTPQRTKVPAGFMDWLRDIEGEALRGSDAVMQAYERGTPEMRACLLRTLPETWLALQRRAEAVDTRCADAVAQGLKVEP
jgi:hypothetical protein